MESGQIKVGSHGTRSVRGVYRASSPLVKYQGLVNDPPPQIAEIPPPFPPWGLLGKFAHKWRPDRFPLIYGIDVSKDVLNTGLVKVAGYGKAHRYISPHDTESTTPSQESHRLQHHPLLVSYQVIRYIPPQRSCLSERSF
jgi:hypothetical protein